MNLKLKNTPEQVELIKAMGSKDQAAAREAQEAFAAFLGPVVAEVIKQAGTAGNIYSDAPFDEDDSPSFPLDLFYNETDNHISVWSQSMAGGLPSSHIEGMSELKLATYRLDSAVSLHRRYARRARLDVVSKAIERMAQEILVKQERNAWAVILKALYEAVSGTAVRHLSKAGGHVMDSTATGVFQLDDLNRMMTLMRRINESWAAGTPDLSSSRGLTDLYMSPEGIEQVRAFAYQPMNTRHGAEATTTAGYATSVALPDSIRESVYHAAGTASIYGVAINEMNEFGASSKYNTLFNAAALGSATDNDVAGELIVGIDASRGAFIRPVAVQAESGGTFSALADDQWSMRSDKLGWYGFLEEGRVCIDARAVIGMDSLTAL